MRISTVQYFRNGVTNIQNARNELGSTQQKISTGKKLLNPSEDPISATQILKLNEDISVNNQYKENINFSVSKNKLEDSILGGVVDSIQRVRDLTIRANSDSMSESDRIGIGVEVESLLDQIVGLLNSKDGTGEYIFGGYQGDSKPFVEQTGGGYQYVGDEGNRRLEIAAGNSIAISDSGKKVFVDIKSENSTILTSASTNNANNSTAMISTGIVVDQAAFDAVYPEDFVVTFNDPLLNQNQRSFNITHRGDGSPVYGTMPAGYMINVPYEDGGVIEFNGVQLFLTGDPQPGDVFFVESSGKESLIDTVKRLATTLKMDTVETLQLASQIEVIGSATPGRSTTTIAGNYVAGQTVTVESENTVQTVDINPNSTAPTIAAAINALTGVSAVAEPTSATLDFSFSTMDEGDIIQFELNEMPISATVGSNNATTWTNIQTAIDAAIAADVISGGPGANLMLTNNNDGSFSFLEPNGENISIQNFEIVDVPAASMSIASGVDPGDTISFTLVGSNGESIDVSYLAAAGDNNELLAALQADLLADPEGDGASFVVSQSVPGAPIAIRYVGDTNGASNFRVSSFSDSSADAQVTLSALSSSSVADTMTSAAATSITDGGDVTVSATDANATVRYTGSIGSPVILLEGFGDSSTVAGRVTILPSENFEVSSDVASAYGGLLRETVDETQVKDDRFQSTMSRVLANIDNALDNILQTRSGVGARINTLDLTLTLNASFDIELKTFLSELQDLDYAEAISNMNMQTMVLEASQNSFVKIARLSLFNFL